MTCIAEAEKSTMYLSHRIESRHLSSSTSTGYVVVMKSMPTDELRAVEHLNSHLTEVPLKAEDSILGSIGALYRTRHTSPLQYHYHSHLLSAKKLS